MNDTTLLSGLMLARPDAHELLAEKFECWSAQERGAFLRHARKEKCFSLVAELYRSAGLLEPASEGELASTLARNRSASEITRRLPRAGILLKGSALERYYTAGFNRDCVDVDLSVRDISDVSDLCRELRALGYETRDTALWVVDPSRRWPLTGAIRFSHSDSSCNVSVEIHFGGVATSLASGIGFDELEAMASRDEPVATPAMTLDPTGQLCVILADYAVRTSTPVTVRHIVDLVYLVEARGDLIDPSRVLDFVRSHSLYKGVALFQRKFVECGLVTNAPVLRALLELNVRGMIKQGQFRRVLAARTGSRMSVRKSTSRVLLFAYRTLTLKALKSPLLRRLVRCVEHGWINLLLARRGMRMAVTPLSRHCRPKTEFRQVGGESFVLTPIGIFYLNQHGFVSNDKRGRLAALIAQVL